MTMHLPQPTVKLGDPSTWPAPPKELMEYGETSENHIVHGKAAYLDMLDVCGRHDVHINAAKRVLDFGCSNGRVTRWFHTANGREVWGCDIQTKKVLWAQEHLGPPIRFMVNRPDPHLPYKSGYFDFICAQSIFTHVQETHVAWLMELCRLLSPGGALFVTLHDAACMVAPRAQLLRGHHFKNYESQMDALDGLGFLAVNEYKDGLAQVYMSEEYLKRVAPPWVTVVGPFARAYSDLQSGYLLRHEAN